MDLLLPIALAVVGAVSVYGAVTADPPQSGENALGMGCLAVGGVVSVLVGFVWLTAPWRLL